LSRDTRFLDTDGFVTNEPGIILTTLHADCAPLFVADPATQTIGLVHAGRRGIFAGMAGELIRRMNREFGSEPASLRVAVGPTISARAYEVSDEVAREFMERFGTSVVVQVDGHSHLDLVGALKLDLERAGVSSSHVFDEPPCTYYDENYGSYRRDGYPLNSMLAWLCML
jgi:polyphenol oxidase